MQSLLEKSRDDQRKGDTSIDPQGQNRFEENSNNGSTILDVRDLTIHFLVRRRLGSPNIVVHAADKVNIKLKRGETLGLVGESGSGKTTVGRGTLRLIEPTSGEVYLNGQNILEMNGRSLRNIRRKMQMVFQDPTDSLNPRFTCKQTLMDALGHAGFNSDERSNKINELIESVGLNLTDLDKYPHQFSGGQQQRIAIARALAFTPELLILDEPTASLDVSVKTQVTDLLSNLQTKYNLSFILISHDLSNVKYMADRVAVMYLGQIVEIGNVCDIFADPVHPYTRVLIESIPIPNPDLVRRSSTLVGEIPSATSPPKGCRFHPRCPIGKDVCSQLEPHLINVGDGHMVACHTNEN